MALAALTIFAFPAAGAALPLGQIDEFSTGIGPGAELTRIVAGSDGNLWFSNLSGGIGRVTPSGAIQEFSTGVGHPSSIVDGPDGNLWFTDLSNSAIGRITTAGAVTEFTGKLSKSNPPDDIALGPDGNLWFVEPVFTGIGRATPGGTITEFKEGLHPEAYARDLTAGADGNLWFSIGGLSRVGRISPEGVIEEFDQADGMNPSASPTGLVKGPDGNVWFADPGHFDGVGKPAIGRIAPNGQVTEFSAGLTDQSWPTDIVVGPDGNLWFTDEGTRPSADPSRPAIGRITPEGQITEFHEGFGRGAMPHRIAVGPDGNLWFSDRHGAIGRITPSGQISEFSAGLDPEAELGEVIAGPDGNVWFIEEDETPAIGRVGTEPVPVSPPPSNACSDLLDSDGDGLVDGGDPGCAGGVTENEAPCATPDYYEVGRGERLTVLAGGGVIGNDVDPEGDDLHARLIRMSFAAKKLDFDPRTGAFSFDASARHSSEGWFDYEVIDSHGAASNVTRAHIAISAASPTPAAPCGRPHRPSPPAPGPGAGSFKTHSSCRASPAQVRRYAPLVRFHPRERYYPSAVVPYLANSALKWGTNGAPRVGVGDIRATALGGIGDTPYYSPIHDSDGHDYSRAFASNEHTRPYDSGRDSALAPAVGWYLDLRDDHRGEEVRYGGGVAGEPFTELRAAAASTKRPRNFGATKVPLLYEVTDRPAEVARRLGSTAACAITYWFFYAYNNWSFKAEHALPLRAVHEADWERLAVYLNRAGKPIEFDYFQHHGAVEMDPEQVAFVHGTHPIVYAAEGSHASYPSAGAWSVDAGAVDRAGDGGAYWSTFRGPLVDVREQPWRGFGGAWGEVSYREAKPADATGPLGPVWKAALESA